MKQNLMLVVALFFLNSSIAFAADSTDGTPSGIAKQPDINQRGSNIIDVGTLETSSIDADSAAISGQIKSGSVDTGSISAGSVNTSGTVSASTLSSPAGAITNLNTNRTYVQRTPTSPVDATNKKYVDDQSDALKSRLSALESDGGGVGIAPSYTSRERVGYKTFNLYQGCPSGYTLFVNGLHREKIGVSSPGGTTTFFIYQGVCMKSSSLRDSVRSSTFSAKQYNGGTDR